MKCPYFHNLKSFFNFSSSFLTALCGDTFVFQKHTSVSLNTLIILNVMITVMMMLVVMMMMMMMVMTLMVMTLMLMIIFQINSCK